MASRISKSLEGTTDIDAITWLLKLETSPNPELFKKLAGLIDSGRADFRPKILESLMPLLSRVIVSPHPPNMEPEGPLEAYVLSLADLAAFKDDKGSWWLLWEDARYHPTLEEPLREKLVELAKHQSPVGSYAVDVLRSFRTYASLQKPQSSKKPQISWDAGASIMNLLGSGNPIVQSAHSYEEMELH